jgi:hypothetical protein
MPEIPPSLPPSTPPIGPAFSLPVSALPEGLKPGQDILARVLAQVSAQRYALAIGGREVLVDSPLALSPGDQLRLVVRQTGTKMLMDLVPLGRPAGVVGSGDPAGAGAGSLRAGPIGPLQAELQSTLANGAPLGELLAESARLLSAAGSAGGAGAAAGPLRDIADRLNAMLGNLAAGEAGEGAGARMAAAVAALPAQVAELLAAVEARLAGVLRALPEAAALGALGELLASLPAATARPAASSAQEPSQQLAGLVDQLVKSLRPSGTPEAQPPQLPAELRQALGALSDRELSALKQLVAERERAALAASPQVAALSGAHRALAAAQDRLDAARLLGLSNSGQAQSFSYIELPVSGGPEAGTAGLRVLVRRSGDEGGGGRGPGRGTVRAVLDLDLSALGPVWSELTLTGRSLAVKLELPDRERSDFVAARLDELQERLAAHGLEASAAAAVAGPRQRRSPEGADPAEDSGGGGINLWA